MKVALTMIAALGLAVGLNSGAVCAADKKTGFDALDKDDNGYLTRSEAAGNARLLKGFDVADKDNDGKLSRTEYLAATAKRKVKDVVGAESDKDPGFKALDKNGDGALTRREAGDNPYLKEKFKAADKNGDGKLSRSEYLAQMAKKDVSTGAAKVEHSVTGK
jgi:Ca2+-binding EF-hand superfamily protein